MMWQKKDVNNVLFFAGNDRMITDGEDAALRNEVFMINFIIQIL